MILKISTKLNPDVLRPDLQAAAKSDPSILLDIAKRQFIGKLATYLLEKIPIEKSDDHVCELHLQILDKRNYETVLEELLHVRHLLGPDHVVSLRLDKLIRIITETEEVHSEN